MGEIEDRLKALDSGKTLEKPIIKSELEKALEEEEAELAREMRIGRAEETIAKRQVRIGQLREQIGKGGAPMTEDERREEEKRRDEQELKEKAERIAQAKALYVSCIDAGGEPKRCAEMVAGLIPSPAGLTAPAPTSVTDLVHALKELDDLRGSDRGLGELKQSFANLAEEIRRGNINRQPLDPVAFARQQAEQIKATYEAMKEMGIIKEPVVTTSDGKSLVVVQEEHRHDERMEEIRDEREYKRELTKIAGDTTERIGYGIGRELSEREGERGGGGSSGGGLEYITCHEEGCGTKIPIMPETGNQVTCPKCGCIYSRKAIVETQEG